MASTTAHTSVERPPIIAVLGHVDHGKSTLLDYIRKSNTVAGEAGGITQHVAAYEVEHELKGATKRITFIDTPGHAAFKSIRARGATIADIAILVVSAEDGVKAQTLEALESIKTSGVPFVVAINKIDKPNANPEKVKTELLEHGVYLEGLGGDIPFALVSAKSGDGISDLLDLLLLVAEMQELNADPSVPAEGVVIETHREPKRGIAASLIITNGSLKGGMAVLAGAAVAPLRIMEDQNGKQLREATFSTPILVVGFDEMPSVGIPFKTFKNRKEAEAARSAGDAGTTAATAPHAETPSDQFILPLIVKADTTGSLEAIQGLVEALGSEHARIRIVSTGIGPVTEADVKMALSSNETQPIIVAFGESADASAEELARQNSILLESFSIIYELGERLEAVLAEREPERSIEAVVGRAKVLKRFSSKRESHVIGGRVEEGQLARRAPVRVMRRGVAVGTGTIANIQSNKQDVERVEVEQQFGAQIDALFEIIEGDELEALVISSNK